MRTLLRAGYLLLAFFTLACGSKGPSVVPVSGRVTLNDAPLVGADVTFTPIDGKEKPPVESSGKTDASGNFTLSCIADHRPGAVLGSQRVRISLFDRGDGKRRGKGQQVPPEYNKDSNLTFTVPAGGTKEANFALKGKLRDNSMR